MEATGGIEICKHEWNKRKCPFCRVDELEAKLERLEKAARAVIDYRLPAPEWEFAMLSLYKALEGEQDND